MTRLERTSRAQERARARKQELYDTWERRRYTCLDHAEYVRERDIAWAAIEAASTVLARAESRYWHALHLAEGTYLE